jgi:hypothetical protein
MIFHRMKNALCTTIIPAVWVASCIDVQEPSAPDVTVEGGGDGTSPCTCPADQMLGRAYRFTSLGVIEPAPLASFMDQMWATELSNYILNILFVVQEASQGDVTAFDAMKLVAGPGWRTPELPYLVEGDTSFSVESYWLMEGLQIELDMIPLSGYQCQIKNTESKSLYFHLGPREDPLMCGPLLDPANATPIKDLIIRFGFNEDCSKIENGYMRGCLSPYDVDRICMCQQASSCPEEGGNLSEPFPTDDVSAETLTQYCKDTCGFSADAATNWTSFGAQMRFLGINETCLTSEGEAGYMLELVFSAEEVTGQFDPSSIQPPAEKTVE